jgi:hypothetical protein
MKTRLLICVALSLVFAPTLGAQSDREQEVLDVIAVMFDGLAARDTAAMRTTFAPGTRLVVTTNREGRAAFRAVPLDDFLAHIADPAAPPIEERYHDPDIRIHDNLATVWVSYTFLVNGEVSHCGEDAFQLARGPEGWKIVAIGDTQRREGCDEPSSEQVRR